MNLTFTDAQQMHLKHPDTFWVEDLETLRSDVAVGDFLKVCINDEERIWTQVTAINGDQVTATLANDPVTFDRQFGYEVQYELRHVYDHMPNDDEAIFA